MSEDGEALLLLAGMVGGSAGAFMVAPLVLPVYAGFVVAGRIRLGGSWIGRASLLLLAPAGALVMGLILGRRDLSVQACRWGAALCGGSYIASEFGFARMLRAFRRASENLRFASPLFDLLAAVAKLSVQWGGRARRIYSRRREEGLGILESVQLALGALSMDAMDEPEPSGSPVGIFGRSAAVLAWGLLLVGIVQV